MKSYAIVCDSHHGEIADQLARALAAQRGVMAGVMDLKEFQAKEAAVCRHRFVIFIGSNAVSRPYIAGMGVHYLGCGVLWGVSDGRAAAVWLGARQRGASRALWDALRTRRRKRSLPNTAAGVYQMQSRRKTALLLLRTLVAPFSRAARDMLAYSVGVFAFLHDAIDPSKAAGRPLAAAS